MRTLYITLLLLFTGICAQAQPGTLSVDRIQVRQTGDKLHVSFSLQAAEKVVKSNQNLILTPILSNGAHREYLPAIVIQGRKARISTERSRIATKSDLFDSSIQRMRNGGTLEYQSILHHETWMDHAALSFDGVTVGCGSATSTTIGNVVNNLQIVTPVKPVEEVIVIPEPKITAQKLAERYAFLTPASGLDELFIRTRSGEVFYRNLPMQIEGYEVFPLDEKTRGILESGKERSVTIYFKTGSTELDRNYRENNQALVELVSVIRAIEESDDSRIARIVIAGFSSPDGVLQQNQKLAWQRAISVQEFLVGNAFMSANRIMAYTGSEDWEGLRRQVAASEMPDQAEVLRIIDHTPVKDQEGRAIRHQQLRNFKGGEPYQYMLRNFFPDLRNAAYIKVYYDTK